MATHSRQLAVQKALSVKLIGAITIDTVVVPVYNGPPTNEVPPYITIKQDVTETFDRLHDRTGNTVDSEVHIHIRDKDAGETKLKQALDDVVTLLDYGTLTFTGGITLVVMFIQDTHSFAEEDGRSLRSVAGVRIIIEG